MLGQHKRHFVLLPYRPEWADLFEQEAELLQSVLGETALQIEHIGSTSIPGMAAKAIIAIMVAVPVLCRSSELILALAMTRCSALACWRVMAYPQSIGKRPKLGDIAR